MKKNLAIFDLDGTLFNTNRVNYMAYDEALKEYGYAVEFDYFCRECNGRHYSTFLPKIIGNFLDVIEQVHLRKKELYSNFLKEAKPNTHLIHILHLIREEYYLAVATTASRCNTEEILRYFDIDKEFQLILTQEDVIHPKPDPEIFLKAMKYFGIGAEHTIIFEDSEVGIKAAGLTGCQTFRIIEQEEANK